jgi:hypothetical protein
MEDEPAYHREGNRLGDDGHAKNRSAHTRRKWIGVRFDCCNAYARIYRSKDGKAYEGRCPHCLRKVRVRIGPGGTDARFFAAQ